MKNFLPGPTQVREDVLAEFSKPVIGHHTSAFKELLGRINPRLQKLMDTDDPVFTLTCSASAAMEAALTNAGGSRILILANGAFGERWLTAARALDLPADALVVAWGLPLPEFEIGRLLDKTNCDTIVIVHGESSTGMLNPIEPVKSALSHRPDVLFIVDAVATSGGVQLSMNQDKIDVLVGASQKCLGLPPGVVPVGVSQRALARSRSARRKGYAFDFSLWHERWKEKATLATPAIPQLYALDYQLERIEKETLKARWQRHQRMLEITCAWASENGMIPFAPDGYRLPSVSCLRPSDGRQTGKVVQAMEQRGYYIGNGYGKLKNRAIRIGHMGDWSEKELEEMLTVLSEVLTERA